MSDFLRELAERAASQREKRAFYTSYGYPGMMPGAGFGGMHGMPLPGYGIPYGGFRPLYGMGGYLGMRPHMMGMHPGLVPPGLPNVLSYRHGYGMPYGNFGGPGGYAGMYGVTDANGLRSAYEAEMRDTQARHAGLIAAGVLTPDQARRTEGQIDARYTGALQRLKQYQNLIGPQSGHSQVYGRPNFEAYGAGNNNYSEGYSPAFAGGGRGDRPVLDPTDRYWNRSDTLTEQARGLRSDASLGEKSPYAEKIQAARQAVQALASQTSREGTWNPFSSELAHAEKQYIDPGTGKPFQFGNREWAYGLAPLATGVGAPLSVLTALTGGVSGEGRNSENWRKLNTQYDELQALTAKQKAWEATQEERAKALEGRAQTYEERAEPLEKAQNKNLLENMGLQQQLHRTQMQHQMRQFQPPPPPPREIHNLNLKPPSVPGQSKSGQSRFLQPVTFDELVERAVECQEDRQLPRSSSYNNGQVKQAFPKKTLITALAAPIVGSLAGMGTGAMTAPQDYAPEGGVRGSALGLGAGLGAGAGLLAGKGLGHLAGLALGNRAGRGLAGHIGAALGALLGGTTGAYAAHRKMPYKPWEAGEPSWLERLDTELRQRPPAPGFEPGYQGPASFFGTPGKTAGEQALDKTLNKAADEDLPDRGKAILAASGKGSLLGGGAGAALSALAALLTSKLGKVPVDLKHTLQMAGLGGAVGSLGGAGLGALHGYQQGKEAGSQNVKVNNGMVPERRRKRGKSPALLETMDSLMKDLSKGK